MQPKSLPTSFIYTVGADKSAFLVLGFLNLMFEEKVKKIFDAFSTLRNENGGAKGHLQNNKRK